MDPVDRLNQPLTSKSAAINLAADTDFTVNSHGLYPFARRIFVGTGGDVVARKIRDSGYTTYKAASGTYLDGAWAIVRSTGNGTTASNLVAEQ